MLMSLSCHRDGPSETRGGDRGHKLNSLIKQFLRLGLGHQAHVDGVDILPHIEVHPHAGEERLDIRRAVIARLLSPVPTADWLSGGSPGSRGGGRQLQVGRAREELQRVLGVIYREAVFAVVGKIPAAVG